MRRKLRRLASSSRNARATVQCSDGRLRLCVPVISYTIGGAYPVPSRRVARCVPCRPLAARELLPYPGAPRRPGWLLPVPPRAPCRRRGTFPSGPSSAATPERARR